MQFSPALEEVTFLRRYKRFLVDVRRSDGTELTVHCPNTGSMKHCVLSSSQRAWISDSGNEKRKYRHTLEALQVAHGHWVGVNTSRANRLVEEAVRQGRILELSPDTGVEREVTFGDSRFDLALGTRTRPHTFIEVKNVTLGVGPGEPDSGRVRFPDAVTVRGQKHLRTLMDVVANGQRAVLFFCVQHTGAKNVAPADALDPHYGVLLREAQRQGVEIIAWQVTLSPREFSLESALPVDLSCNPEAPLV